MPDVPECAVSLTGVPDGVTLSDLLQRWSGMRAVVGGRRGITTASPNVRQIGPPL